jgi:hypothetical protein
LFRSIRNASSFVAYTGAVALVVVLNVLPLKLPLATRKFRPFRGPARYCIANPRQAGQDK